MDTCKSLNSNAVLNIDLSALGANYSYFASLAKKSETAAVVKADGYGIGAIKCAQIFQDLGCKNFFVAHLKEAVELRRNIGAVAQIFILNGIFAGQEDIFLKYNLIPVLNCMEQVTLWNLGGNRRNCALHIDTGMNRLGLDLDEIGVNRAQIFNLNIGLIISHLACGSEPDHPLNIAQLDRFEAAKQILPDSKYSIAASGGTMLGARFHQDLVRIGIGLYGSNPLDIGQNPLKPVVQLLAPIIQTRKIKKGASIGYGASFVAPKDMAVAIVALGYADGYLRSASNCGTAAINGEICKILGRVSMDLIAIDISELPNVPQMGTMVEFIGPTIELDMVAKTMNTISYEILTRLGNRFTRNYLPHLLGN